MSELRDFRTKLTPESDQMLDAIARAEGRDKSEIVREIVHRWAVSEFHRFQMIQRLVASDEGTVAALEGGPKA